MKQFILSLSILLIGFTAKSDNKLKGHGRHMIVNEWYPNGTTFTVTPDNGIVNIQLENTFINFNDEDDRAPCIDIKEGNQVRIILKGDNFLQGGSCCPAIRVHPGSELFIDGYSEGNGSLGRLVARGGNMVVHTVNIGTNFGSETRSLPGGAGIGGGWDYIDYKNPPKEYEDKTFNVFKFVPGLWNPFANNEDIPDEYKYHERESFWTQGYGGCGKIHINGAIVEAYGGGKWAPGIGPAGLFAQGGQIVVQLGSQVYAKGGENAPGIGCSDYSRVHEIKVADGNTRVVAEGGDGAPGIGGGVGQLQRNCRIDAINLAGGYIVAKAGNPENDGMRTPPAIGAMGWGETPSFNFINGVVDVSDGGINASPETVTYRGGNVIVHNTNTAMNFPDRRVSNKLATVVFTDPDITTSEGLTFKVGDNDYVHPGVTGGEDRRLTDDKKMQLHLTSDQTGKVTVYENGLLRYEETA
ncbi:MAG: hypothetical protein LBF08_04365, partial [Dysgonamonadaceae bacterium]|nr:hypothetical protein [Dysgonamonadaceae bacterium]